MVFISVPLTLRYLGTERYGLWMTISSVIAVLGFSDLGLNNGLLNGISQANGTNDRELARRYVSSAFFFSRPSLLRLELSSSSHIAGYPGALCFGSNLRKPWRKLVQPLLLSPLVSC